MTGVVLEFFGEGQWEALSFNPFLLDLVGHHGYLQMFYGKRGL